jgi:hypothetical protein
VGLRIGAFLIASAIPNVGDLVSVVASLFAIQYTYRLPRLLRYCGFAAPVVYHLGRSSQQALISLRLYHSCLNSNYFRDLQHHSFNVNRCSRENYGDCVQLSQSNPAAMISQNSPYFRHAGSHGHLTLYFSNLSQTRAKWTGRSLMGWRDGGVYVQHIMRLIFEASVQLIENSKCI